MLTNELSDIYNIYLNDEIVETTVDIFEQIVEETTVTTVPDIALTEETTSFTLSSDYYYDIQNQTHTITTCLLFLVLFGSAYIILKFVKSTFKF